METKPGWQTTEFWLTLATQVVGILLLVGVISPEQSQVLNEAMPQIAGGVGELIGGIMMAAGAFGYSRSRGEAKRK